MQHSVASNSPAIVRRQRELLRERYAQLVGPGENYALVDFPDHSNVGDSAIWLGEVSLLREITGDVPSYVCTHGTYDRAALQKAVPEGPIFFHGGGNIGDIWPSNQAFRERILSDFPDRKIVLLPSSIHFQDSANIDKFNRALAGTKSTFLFVRDRPSLAIAQASIDCPVELTPDSALGLGVIEQPARPVMEVFGLLRTDVEASGRDYTALREAGVEIDDWLVEPQIDRRRLRNRAIFATLLNGSLSGAKAKARQYNLIAQTRVDRGLAQLCQGEAVVSDRLHAHILCTLMGKAHVALDNSYGKVSGYWDNWHREVNNVRFARNVDEIGPALRELGMTEIANRISPSR